MKVSELIEFLKTQPQDLEFVYQCGSEQVLMESFDITVKTLGEARPDGWVANARPDKPTKQYLCLSGN